jgi:hypothetical protein
MLKEEPGSDPQVIVIACGKKATNTPDLPPHVSLLLAPRQDQLHNPCSLLVSLFNNFLLFVRNKPAVPGDFFLYRQFLIYPERNVEFPQRSWKFRNKRKRRAAGAAGRRGPITRNRGIEAL